ncbi:hypothetical protein [Halobacillus sp. H74]|uniref:hypothetical protein n=1 Tax=Halobacillus sp. H74 TaxID=3457436 RepID=UPI003FCC2A54
MKGYITFIITFLVTYGVLELVSGLLLTLSYTAGSSTYPTDPSLFAQEAMPIVLMVISASVAYFVSKNFVKH